MAKKASVSGTIFKVNVKYNKDGKEVQEDIYVAHQNKSALGVVEHAINTVIGKRGRKSYSQVVKEHEFEVTNMTQVKIEDKKLLRKLRNMKYV